MAQMRLAPHSFPERIEDGRFLGPARQSNAIDGASLTLPSFLLWNSRQGWYSSTMATLTNSTAFDGGTDLIFRILTREQIRRIADYHVDEELQSRIEELASEANEGELTDEERAEYEGYVQANSLVAVLQARARRMLAAPART